MVPLTAEVMAPRLQTRWLGRAWRHLATCRSTNDEAAAWARAGAPTGAVLVASAQSGGRGRLGRRWHSPPDENLYFSAVLRPPVAPEDAPPLTLAVGVAVAEAISGCGILPQLKWPNDVLLDGKKVAGILCEMSCQGAHLERVVVGVGVNVDAPGFPDELARSATSLRLARGDAPVDGAGFTAALCRHLEDWHDRWLADGAGAVVRAWKSRALPFGRRVHVTAGNEAWDGVTEDLDDDGALLLRTDGGERVRVTAGELSLGEPT
jgi:BirA family biotin operon repressor/biotin-[acetyl-CoA-carboxylase] ligase